MPQQRLVEPVKCILELHKKHEITLEGNTTCEHEGVTTSGLEGGEGAEAAGLAAAAVVLEEGPGLVGLAP